MRPERIETLLRRQAPDEPDHVIRPLLEEHAPGLLRSATVRPSKTAAGGIAWAAVLVVAAIGIAIGAIALRREPAASTPLPATSGAVPSGPAPSLALGVIPWIDATPGPSATPEPTPDPSALPACVPEDLALVAGGWGGATGSMAGGADLINVSPNPCHLWNPAGAQLTDSTGTVIARLDPAIAAGGPESGAFGIPSGGDVTGTLVWINWCGTAPRLPLSITVFLADGPEKTVSIDSPSLTAVIDSWEGGSGTPRCDSPGGGSSVGSISFRPPEPSSGGYEPEPCAASSLAAFSGGWGAAAGSSYAHLVVLNDGGVDCLLPTSPGLQLRDAQGGLLASASPWPDAPQSILLPAGWTAVATMTFSDWCAPPPPMPLALDIVLGSPPALAVGRSGADVAAIPLPWCGSAPATPPPFFGWDQPFTVPGAPRAPEPDPIDTLPVTVTISALSATAPGSVLTYTVTLTNVSAYDKSLNLALLCPTYVERLDLPGADSQLDTTHALNCGPAGTLAGGASVTFEMRLPIPSTAQAGTAGIVWQLGQRGPAAKALFQIRP